MNTGKLAPAGWHVPTLSEWNALATYLKGHCGPLKEIGFTHWIAPNAGATNTTGFTAVPAGNRPDMFANMGYFAIWWSSTQMNAISSYEWMIRTDDEAYFGTENSKLVGNAVRCLKD